MGYLESARRETVTQTGVGKCRRAFFFAVRPSPGFPPAYKEMGIEV
jgi:hypothetical protein